MPPVKIAAKSELPAPGKAKEFSANGKMVCIANVDGEICAMDNICLHWGGPLGQGVVEGGKVVCPWHGWTYDPKTGETAKKPGARLTIYQVTIEGEDAVIQCE